MRRWTYVLAAMVCAVAACGSPTPKLSTFTVPETHTDLGVEITVVADGDCLVADHEGTRVGVAFPKKSTRDDTQVKLPDGSTVPVGRQALVGGFAVDQAEARDKYELDVASGCETERWFLLW